ncbi:ATP/GTP-binding protein [Chitinophaga sp. Cy-1792]|uniref:AAA family ATPase n=1 Tax=Chitinophaga sp. Cy-1792 TaxID=2608339 RepID=UPI0014223D5C|nr:ATP-binding protein [Chitinophaga sp. Cy-1792]NIG55070.1 ATP-binding protein [Chitinophaga sp. Cy-1792]
MLIEFKFRNYLSFKDEVSFLMTPVKSFKELEDDNIIKTSKGFDLIKVAAVYGVNGSGKSNFITAYYSFTRVIFNSFRDSLDQDNQRKVYLRHFLLNTASERENTMFEVSFLKGQYIYRYGYELHGNTIKKEWLYRKQDREILLFKRDNQQYQINHESFEEGEKFHTEVNKNVLLLSHLAQYNQPVSQEVLEWFQSTATIDGIDQNPYTKLTANMLKEDNGFRKWATVALKYLEIANIEAGEKDGEIITYHRRYDANNLIVGSLPFSPNMESDGTRKLIHILGPVYLTLRIGGILFIDEFDCKLHPNLTKKLLELFHKYNKRNAQFIFSAQDTNLLDKDLLRRDQIWFTNKDQFGVSTLYPLSDFSTKAVRNTSDFAKKYLDNTFGAADTIEITDKLTDLLYGE